MAERVPEIHELQAEASRLLEEAYLIQGMYDLLQQAAQETARGNTDEAQDLLRQVQHKKLETELATKLKDQAVEMLVDCRRSVARNSLRLFGYPFTKIRACPGPLKRMGKQIVVLHRTGSDMIYHRLAVVPTAALDVSSTESAQQQLGLVEPRGARRRITHPRPWGLQPLYERLGLTRNVTRSVVHDQVHAYVFPPEFQVAQQCRTKVRTIIGIQTCSPHLPVVRRHRHQQVNRTVTNVLELLLLNMAWDHQADRPGPLQDLDAGLLIHTDHQNPALQQPRRTFIAPQDLGRLPDSLCVPNRGLPVSPTMGLQCGNVQNVCDRRVVDRRHNLQAYRHRLQRTYRPMRQFQPVLGRWGTRQVLNPRPTEGGKTSPVGPSEEHRIPLRSRVPRTADTPARSWPGPAPHVYSTVVPVPLDAPRAGSEPDERYVVPSSHCATMFPVRLHPPPATLHGVASDLAWIPSQIDLGACYHGVNFLPNFAYSPLVDMRVQAELEEGDYRKAALLMWKSVRENPRDSTRWRGWIWATTQERLQQRRQERDEQLDIYTKRVDGEGKWWLSCSLFSAAAAFGTFIYAVLRLIHGITPLELVTPLYTIVPGVVSALFFRQYSDAKRRVDEQYAKAWELFESFEQADIQRADEKLMLGIVTSPQSVSASAQNVRSSVNVVPQAGREPILEQHQQVPELR